MDENRVEGTARKAAGRVEAAVGGLTGDAETQAHGNAQAMAGDVQQKVGAALDTARSFAEENPLLAVGIAAGVAFTLGMIIARR
jgi:uncharacterized protein YjbJ (UPF0337 family)